MSQLQQLESKSQSNNRITSSHASNPTAPELSAPSGDETLRTKEESEFVINTRDLCTERNIPFEKIKNARDFHINNKNDYKNKRKTY